jgi:DNA polymerase IV
VLHLRAITHIDMNAFYCSCHTANNPGLYQGKPTAVAGNPETRHGILVTASYEARAQGVKATMTVAEAKRLCPSIILIPPDFELYRAYSNKVFSVVYTYTPIVEVFSIDECFADMTGSSQFGSPVEIANQLQKRILQELGLPCSIGIGPNRFLAKMASDFRKPLGITEIWPDNVSTLLWTLSIDEMFGVGKQTAKRLRNLGIETIGDLAHYQMDKLIRFFGVRGKWLHDHANGRDDSPVNPDNGSAKSIGHSVTLAEDTRNEEDIQATLLNLADQVGRRVRKHNLAGKAVSVTIRFGNLKTITRSRTLDLPTDLTEDIYSIAKSLVLGNLGHHKVRLLGVSLGQLSGREETERQTTVQTSLFSDPPDEKSEKKKQDTIRLRKLTEVTDRLRNRYGEDIVIRGSMLNPHESNRIRDKKIHGTSLQKDTLDNRHTEE